MHQMDFSFGYKQGASLNYAGTGVEWSLVNRGISELYS